MCVHCSPPTFFFFCSPEFPELYQSDEEQVRLMGLYQDLHSCLHHPTRPLRSFYRCSETENLLAWVGERWSSFLFQNVKQKTKQVSCTVRKSAEIVDLIREHDISRRFYSLWFKMIRFYSLQFKPQVLVAFRELEIKWYLNKKAVRASGLCLGCFARQVSGLFTQVECEVKMQKSRLQSQTLNDQSETSKLTKSMMQQQCSSSI